MYRTAPLATDAGIFALSWTLFALIGLMVIDRLVGKLIATVPAPTGQLGYCLLYGQVTRRWVLADISTTIRAGRILIAESVIFVLFLLEREKEKTGIQGETVADGRYQVSFGSHGQILTYHPPADESSIRRTSGDPWYTRGKRFLG